ncbi:MAG: hypothetical protein AAGJ53_09325, partial [Pseudomonadota bacterium]
LAAGACRGRPGQPLVKWGLQPSLQVYATGPMASIARLLTRPRVRRDTNAPTPRNFVKNTQQFCMPWLTVSLPQPRIVSLH